MALLGGLRMPPGGGLVCNAPRLLLSTGVRCVTCCVPRAPLRVSARDSGKPLLDAIVGEVVVTCEKIHWLCKEGEKHLRPERRSAGIMVRARYATRCAVLCCAVLCRGKDARRARKCSRQAVKFVSLSSIQHSSTASCWPANARSGQCTERPMHGAAKLNGAAGSVILPHAGAGGEPQRHPPCRNACCPCVRVCSRSTRRRAWSTSPLEW